ncbi:MAG: VOC family protein [Clostridiales bacterium]|jgi:PhnB protein|nr:VOC family protein [Clostridiales bacterium]
MAIEVYLVFNGNCREAVEFYSNAFDAQMQPIMTYGEANIPGDFSEEDKNLVMHTYLIISGSRVMFSDSYPGDPVNIGNNISITILSKNIEEIKTWFNRLKEGGTVEMDLQETFWSKCYGSLIDRFGVCWQFNYDGE